MESLSAFQSVIWLAVMKTPAYAMREEAKVLHKTPFHVMFSTAKTYPASCTQFAVPCTINCYAVETASMTRCIPQCAILAVHLLLTGTNE